MRLRFFAPGPVLEETIWPRVAAAAASSELVVRSTRERYEPEVERYGGPWGLALAEELFHRQSETALALLDKIPPGTRPQRLGKGLLAMLVLLFLYRGERRSAAELARRYGTSYLKAWAGDAEEQERWLRTFQEAFDRQADRLAGYVESAWEALESGGELTPELDAYRRDMEDVARRLRELFDQGRLRLDARTAADWDECVRWIVPSYIHMMNNRLGVSIQEESYLSVLIAGTLGKAGMATTEFLDTALAIGRRLARRALWEGTACTWDVLDPQPDPENRVRTTRAEGQLYQGAAGIAWFLGELYRATGDAEVGRAARGGLEHALSRGDHLSDLFGFHSGRVGLAWVAVRLAEIFERPDYAERARRLLAPLAGRESEDSGLDVIGGAGGAIPACLDLAEKAGWDELRPIARELGEHLIGQAQRRPDGWSWATGGESAVRNLAGFAHGASGMGLALLELDLATGDGRFRFAAEMAFLYERRLFNEERSNWPDLRHKDLGDALFYQRMDELRRAVRDGKPPVYEETYMTAWCHGSPGIGLARLRAFELTGQDLYRQEAEAALRSTLQAIEDELSQGGNYSLCHGIGGNCELPLLAAEILGDPELRQVVERAARQGIETYEARGRPWPCGTRGGVPDPEPARGRGRNRRLLPAPRRSRDPVGPPAAPANREDGDGGSRLEPTSGSSPGSPPTTSSPPPSASGPLAPPGSRSALLGTGRRASRPHPGGRGSRDPRRPSRGREPGVRARLEDAFEPERVRYDLPWRSSTPPRPCCAASSVRPGRRSTSKLPRSP